MAEGYLFDTGAAFESGRQDVIRTEQAQAQLQDTLAQAGTRQQDYQIKQQQIGRFNDLANATKSAKSSLEQAGKEADAYNMLQETATQLAKTDPGTAGKMLEEASKMQEDIYKAKDAHLTYAKHEQEGRAKLYDQLATGSKDEVSQTIQSYLDANPINEKATPEEKAARATALQLQQAVNNSDMPGSKSLADLQKGFAHARDSLEPIAAQQRALALAEKTREADRKAELKAKEDAETIRQHNMEAAYKKDALDAHKDSKAALDSFKVTNALNAEEHKYTNDIGKLTDERKRLLEELNKLEGLGQASVTKSSGGFLGIGTTETKEDSPAAVRIKKELSNLGEEKTRQDQRHEKALARIDPENYKVEKPVAPATGKIDTPTGQFTLDQLTSFTKEALSKPGAEVEAIKARYKKLSGKDYLEEVKPVSKEKPSMSQDEIRSRIAEINKIITPSGDRISTGKTSYIEASNLAEERRKLKQKLYS